ncbi:MAG: macrolide ABC transporter ATP-binding protein [Elusimicrobia bacterium CG_4_9_14_3_um_filter_62_55]|nr:MAG: macrolide ABC transporter ATP-binding protein [Elusimicrobia bacterium CG22_combo_CG10-13_8_21_14_all_63_91]PJB26806.1 MAG: macrolide ABC transporter ATP-binding protein [Elusimicrobia bacterium CG_4_9_14_3_um_filter_62_55]
MTPAEPLIKVKSVTKIYDGALAVTALKSVSLDFARGEFTAIAGPSGSGKSTLLNIIGTLDSPTKGEVLYEGRHVSTLSENQLADFRLLSLGFVFQAYNLIPVLTAFENVEYVLALQGVPGAERRERAMEALKWVGLEAQADRRPDLLSGGQQQRVAVARSIVHRPMVVLADEPTANLDSKTAESLLELMARLNQEHGVTFLFSSHDPRVLERARRVVEILDGKLQQ